MTFVPYSMPRRRIPTLILMTTWFHSSLRFYDSNSWVGELILSISFTRDFSSTIIYYILLIFFIHDSFPSLGLAKNLITYFKISVPVLFCFPCSPSYDIIGNYLDLDQSGQLHWGLENNDFTICWALFMKLEIGEFFYGAFFEPLTALDLLSIMHETRHRWILLWCFLWTSSLYTRSLLMASF